MLEFCKNCGSDIILQRGDAGPSIDHYGTCGKCGARYTRLTDAKTGKVTHRYYVKEKEDQQQENEEDNDQQQEKDTQ